ncbi:MAG: D-alanyl-D-alanine carboxypeptidase/D-alanyl-D-alanine-endopeptidase (penicillin-binding protein 4) [Yoonia sp.]|jgi:D-alanyl-D-alanine carboxypeptidase/D-alanyl-D-alanine-endopeptidase (penicillin-binding protein 4)
MRLSRRAILAGAVSSLATTAFAQAPLTSMRPVARVSVNDAVTRMVANAGLSGNVGVIVVDLATGEEIENIDAATAQPPASVTKAFTALYALDVLGPNYQFKTRVFAKGEIKNGILDGNLILAGGGDPELVTNDLFALAQTLKESGLREVKGDFFVWDEALRNVDEIDSDQLDHFGYNPSVTGLNLNFNRVHFEWKREDDDFITTMDARSENYRPSVTTSRINIVDQPNPVFTYRDVDDVDQWTVARSSLNDEGSRWLPVRKPGLYAGEVFAIFARSHGIVLKAPQETLVEPAGQVLASYESAPLMQVMQGMLRYSTNLTAEAVGLTATNQRVGEKRGMRTSAIGMARWMTKRCGGIIPHFVDHSGLGDLSRVSPVDMVKMLSAPGVLETLQPILRDIRLVGDDDQIIDREGVSVRAKTGTLNFVSTLAGYVRTDKDRDLAFAIFASDLHAREVGKQEGSEQPRGARTFNTRARRLQQNILKHLALRLPA